MVGRRSLLLVAVALFGLCVWIDPDLDRLTVAPDDGRAAPDAETPLVAVRGRPLAPHEEPLPAGARVRIGSTRYRHPTDLHSVSSVVARDYLVTIADGRVTLTHHATGRRVWSRRTGSASWDLWGRSPGPAFAVSPDGRRLVTHDTDGSRAPAGAWHPNEDVRSTVRVWHLDPDPGRPVRSRAVLPFRSGEPLLRPAFHFTPDGRDLAVSDGGALAVFDLASGRLLRQFESETAILDVAPAAGRYLTGSERRPTSPWAFSISGMSPYRLRSYRFRPRTEPVEDARPTLEDVLVTYTSGRSRDDEPINSLDLVVRESTGGGVVATIAAPPDLGMGARSLRLSPDGRFVSADVNRDVLVWEADTGRHVLRLRPTPTRQRRPTFALVRFTPDSRWIVAVEWPDRERHFDLASGRELPATRWVPTARPEPVPGSDLAVRVDETGLIRRWEPTTVRELRPPPGYVGVVMDVSPDGRQIAVGDAAGRLDVWRTNGTWVTTLRGGGKRISAVRFSPDGGRLAACDRDRVVRVWAVDSWRERQRIAVPADDDLLCPSCLTFTPDGRRLLVSRGDVMALCDLRSCRWLWDLPGERIDDGDSPPPAIFQDGGHLLTPSLIRLETPTGNYHGDIEHLSPVPFVPFRDGRAFALSPDGRSLAVDRPEDDLSVIDCASGRVTRQFLERKGRFLRRGVLRFSPDGRRLVTCDDAGHAHVWEVATGQLAYTLTYPDGAIHDVRFGADGRSLITANHREVIVWDLTPGPGVVTDPWADLAHEAPKADRARRALLADPGAAVELLRNRLRPAGPVDPAAVARMVAGLDGDDYRKRERAAAGLRAIGRRVLPHVRPVTAGSEERRVRLAALVRDLDGGPTADELRQVRAVEVMEQIGSPAARALLDQWAAGDPAAVLTTEAAKARGRGR